MLQVTDLQKSYGNVHSVNGISFFADNHEVVGLLGPNGAGKSTTMRMLSGYLAPTAGDIELCHIHMADHPREAKQLIGYLPEIPSLYPDMTVMEHLRFVCSLRGISPRQAKHECERVCGLLSITAVAGRMIGRLSKGFRQRVGFAAALLGEPRLLILDEPTVGFDPQQMIEIRALIRSLASNMTVLISSHILSEINYVCSRLLIMNNGKIAADGTAHEITDLYRDTSILSVTVRGSRELAKQILHLCVDTMGSMTVEEGPEDDETVFVITTPKSVPMAETVFRAVAGQSDMLTITALLALTPSIEDIFISITQGKPFCSPADVNKGE